MAQLSFELRPPTRRIVVKYSGGVTSAWALGWALEMYPRDEVIALFHDTKEEHPDTYRFLHEMAARLRVEITERSDGRSVTELFRDEGMLGNNQNTMCSRILKTEPGEKFFADLKAEGHAVVVIVGFSAREPKRVSRWVGFADRGGYSVRFPVIEQRVTKQQCADWCLCAMGVRPSEQYEDFEHANCEGCVKGGRDYFLRLHEKRPAVFWQRAGLEDEFGHTIIRGGDREHPTLRELVTIGLKRKVNPRERIDVGSCECGD